MEKRTSCKETSVFVRFSTVNGFRGSNETVRDASGFATNFYTQEGNYDLVGNNHPVFLIQDAIKFPDLVHSLLRRSLNDGWKCPRFQPPNILRSKHVKHVLAMLLFT